MFSSHSTVFGIYSRRALMIMATRAYEALESLLSFLLYHRLELGLYPVILLFSWWFLQARGDPPTIFEQGQKGHRTGGLDSGDPVLENGSVFAKVNETIDDALKRAVCYHQTQPSLVDGSLPLANSDLSARTAPKVPQVTLRHIQPKTSFLELRLNDISNRSLSDSIWATPTKTSIESDKTPTQESYSQKINFSRAHCRPLSNEDGLCSNQAKRAEKLSLEEKMKAFERKNMGISLLLEGALQPTSLRRNRSFPRLRHSVLAWWAGVEQEQADEPELPMEPQIPSDLEEDSNCSICEVIQPWDSWSAAIHNLRSANNQDMPDFHKL